MPDPFVVAEMSAGNAPAGRGEAQAMFDDVPVERFGASLLSPSVGMVCPLK